MVGRARVSAARGAHDDALPRLLLQTARQAAAARAELLRLLEPGVLQDALGERSSQAALTGAVRQAFTCNTHGKDTLGCFFGFAYLATVVIGVHCTLYIVTT